MPLAQHPLHYQMTARLQRNIALQGLDIVEVNNLKELLSIAQIDKDETLLAQGCIEMNQFFILEGLLKRTVTSKQGKEMTLRIAGEYEFETCYAAWSLGTCAPFSIIALKKSTVAKCSIQSWKRFLDHHEALKRNFEYLVMDNMSEIMAHIIALHLLDADGRMERFRSKHPELLGQLPKKELAHYLNITPETFSRVLRHTQHLKSDI